MVRLYWILLMLSLFACDNSAEFFRSLNGGPDLAVIKDGVHMTVVEDSMKVSTSKRHFFVDITIGYADENHNLKGLRLVSEAQDLYVIQWDTLLVGGELEIQRQDSDSTRLSFFSYSPGLKIVTIQAIDDFGSKEDLEIRLHAMENRLPVATYRHTVNRDNNFVYFDFSGSYDQDAGYGGAVVGYEVVFNESRVFRNKDEITVVYSDHQLVYDFVVRVMDNEGAFSKGVEGRLNLSE